MGNIIPNYKIYEHGDGTFGIYACSTRTYYTFDSEISYEKGTYTYSWYESQTPVFKNIKNEWYKNSIPKLSLK
jgi:hypothetical protein